MSFPVGKDAQRPSKYPTNDGLNWRGIKFPTPLKNIDILEKQNPCLAINVYWWEKDDVIVHRISEKPKTFKRINLTLIHKDGNTHYCFVKRLSALLYGQTKHGGEKHFSEMCLTCLSMSDILARHAMHCSGVNGRQTKIEMAEEGENILKCQNHQKQMKAPFIIYADFEALIQNIPENSREKTSCMEKTDRHEACGFAFTVVRSDGKREPVVKYRQGVDGQNNAVEVFLGGIQEGEKKLGEALETPAALAMTNQGWWHFKNAQNCHICEEGLVRPELLDLVPARDKDMGKYCGQSNRRCRWEVTCTIIEEEINGRLVKHKIPFIGPRNKSQEKDALHKWIEKTKKIACSAESCCFGETSGT